MNTARIVQCAECPRCKTYVPIPTAILANLTAAPMRPPTPTDLYTIRHTTTPTPQQYSSTIIRVNPVKGTSNPVEPVQPLSDYENSWRGQFWSRPVLIHGIVEIALILLIVIFEIVSLALSTYSATGAGFWCSIPFMITAVLTIKLVTKWNRSRLWATRVFIAQIVLLIFSFILIGIVGSFVSANSVVVSLYSSSSIYGTTYYGTNFLTKYQIMQAQLAFAILLMFAGFAYLIFYGVVTYLAIWKPFQTLDIPHLFQE